MHQAPHDGHQNGLGSVPRPPPPRHIALFRAPMPNTLPSQSQRCHEVSVLVGVLCPKRSMYGVYACIDS